MSVDQENFMHVCKEGFILGPRFIVEFASRPMYISMYVSTFFKRGHEITVLNSDKRVTLEL